ncbi:hypothetical protein EIP91_005638 [Steccherinum ochraceum]|uniref:Uncharacterized protein n=1 Tax=Steccherinum ochraceum TaxID=92696 RepID=A0A4R0R6Y2_9APHY|nr:hypothetical protein EIP91_005638 [Steccherinum ochraceum]
MARVYASHYDAVRDLLNDKMYKTRAVHGRIPVFEAKGFKDDDGDDGEEVELAENELGEGEMEEEDD